MNVLFDMLVVAGVALFLGVCMGYVQLADQVVGGR